MPIQEHTLQDVLFPSSAILVSGFWLHTGFAMTSVAAMAARGMTTEIFIVVENWQLRWNFQTLACYAKTVQIRWGISCIY